MTRSAAQGRRGFASAAPIGGCDARWLALHWSGWMSVLQGVSLPCLCGPGTKATRSTPFSGFAWGPAEQTRANRGALIILLAVWSMAPVVGYCHHLLEKAGCLLLTRLSAPFRNVFVSAANRHRPILPPLSCHSVNPRRSLDLVSCTFEHCLFLTFHM